MVILAFVLGFFLGVSPIAYRMIQEFKELHPDD